MGKLNRRIFLPQAVWTVPQPRPTTWATTHIPDLRQEPRDRELLSAEPPPDRGPVGIPWIGAPGGAPAWGALSLPQPCPWSLPNFQTALDSPHLEEPGAKRSSSDLASCCCSLRKSHQKNVWSHSRQSILFLLKNKYL